MSTCTFRTQFLARPVLIHLPKEHGTLQQWSVDGSQMQAWGPAHIDNVVTVKDNAILVWPNHVVSLVFAPVHPKETGVFFRFLSQTPDGLAFQFSIKCQVAPLESTVAVLSPYYNRVAIMPWFLIGIILFAVVCAILAIAFAYGERESLKQSKICKPLELGWRVVFFVVLAILLGFLAFWSIVQGYENAMPKALSCVETKATVAAGKCLYTYTQETSAWRRFLCRVMGICSTFPATLS